MTEFSKGQVAGVDVGDEYSYVHMVDEAGQVVEETRVLTSPQRLRDYFGKQAKLRVALETGTHSPWISRLLEQQGHEVLVANARQVRLIYAGQKKTDQLDAEKLARLARLDPQLLAPIQHRSEQAQAELAIIKAREGLVKSRTALVNQVRGQLKSFGATLPKCGVEVFAKRSQAHIPAELQPALNPLVQVIETLTKQIRAYDQKIDALTANYPETSLLTKIVGVGNLTALCFVLTLEDPSKFKKSRSVGAFLGLTPGRDQSGQADPRQGITKHGDVLLRKLLVQCANYILRNSSPDCDLKRFGLHLAKKMSKSQAVIAVARKLAVLLHRLWSTGEVYDPRFLATQQEQHSQKPQRQTSSKKSTPVLALAQAA
jgi:transposase